MISFILQSSIPFKELQLVRINIPVARASEENSLGPDTEFEIAVSPQESACQTALRKIQVIFLAPYVTAVQATAFTPD